MTVYQYPNYLMHHGVKGMKWGVRRARSRVTSRYSSDYNKTRKLRRKSSKKLSNDELKELNNRMRLEQEYNRLSTSSVNRGMEIAKKAIAAAGVVGGAYAVGKSDYAKAGASIVKELIGKMR